MSAADIAFVQQTAVTVGHTGDRVTLTVVLSDTPREAKVHMTRLETLATINAMYRALGAIDGTPQIGA